MKSAIAVLLVAGATASIIPRDLPTVLADIADIKSKVAALTPTISNFKSLDTDAVPLLAAEGAVETAIKKGTSDADATDPVDVAGANQVLSAIKDLIPTVVGSLNAAVGNYDTFQTAGAGQILSMRLNTLKTLTDAFAASLIKKAPMEAQSAAQAAIGCIDSGFANALKTPPTQATDCSGDVVLPSGGGGGGSSGPTTTTTPPTSGGVTTPPVTTTTTSGGSAPVTTPTGSSSSYSASSLSRSSSSTSPTSTGGAVYTGDAASLAQGLVGAVCAAGLAFLL